MVSEALFQYGGNSVEELSSSYPNGQEAERENAYTNWLSPFPLCILSGPPDYSVVLPMFMESLSLLVNSLWKHLHRCIL
jgi:hypothetical protein